MQTVMLAEASREASNQFVVGSFAALIAGILFLMIGYILARIFLSQWEESADRIERDNKKLAQMLNSRQYEYIEGRNSMGGHN